MKIGGAFVIHLARATARAQQVAKIQDALPLPVTILDAVDGRAVGDAALDRYDPKLGLKPAFPFGLSIGEAACFLSHRAAWARIIDAGWDAGLVVEDDAGMDPPQIARALTLATAHPGDGIVQLQSRAPGPGRIIAQDNDITLSEPEIAPLRATCNLYTRDACAKLLAVTERFDRPVDVVLQMSWVTGLKPRVIWPSGVSEASLDVGGTTIQKKGRHWTRQLVREIQRPLFRAAMKRRVRKAK